MEISLNKNLFDTSNYYIIDKNFDNDYNDVYSKVERFKALIERTFDNEAKRNFKRNISTLYIKKENKLQNEKANAEYSADSNTIFIKRDSGLTIYHELWHAASASEVGYIGFEKNRKYRGLNEGYTDLMTKRYFDDGTHVPHYKIEFYFCLMIESIISKSIMERLYLKADVDSLINEFSKYLDHEKVIKVFELLDIICNEAFGGKDISSKDAKHAIKQLYIYLVEAFAKKTYIEYRENKITKELASKLIKNFLDKWEITVIGYGEDINFTNDKIKAKLIKNNLYNIEKKIC